MQSTDQEILKATADIVVEKYNFYLFFKTVAEVLISPKSYKTFAIFRVLTPKVSKPLNPENSPPESLLS